MRNDMKYQCYEKIKNNNDYFIIKTIAENIISMKIIKMILSLLKFTSDIFNQYVIGIFRDL